MQKPTIRKPIFAGNRQRRKMWRRLGKKVNAGVTYILAEIKAQAFLS